MLDILLLNGIIFFSLDKKEGDFALCPYLGQKGELILILDIVEFIFGLWPLICIEIFYLAFCVK